MSTIELHVQLANASATSVLGEYTIEAQAVPRVGEVLYLHELSALPSGKSNCFMVAEVSHVMNGQTGRLDVHLLACQCSDPERDSGNARFQRQDILFRRGWQDAEPRLVN